MKKQMACFLSILTLLASIAIVGTATADTTQSSSLNVTVKTDKLLYYLDEYVSIFGNLTQDGSPVQGLVAIEAYRSSPKVDTPLILRTLPTGNIPPTSWQIEVIGLYSCDKDGKPKESFKLGEKAYSNATIRNNSVQTLSAIITINAYDINGAPLLAISSATVPILPPGAIASFVGEIMVSEKASVGQATVYASALTDWPRNQGIPYCPEKSATFTIENGAGQSQASSTTYTPGKYNLTFQLPYEGKKGTYSVYVGATYIGWKSFSGRTFIVKVPGDANDDGVVNIYDVTIVCAAYDTKPGDPDWDFDADLDKDGDVDIYDVVIVAGNYGRSGL